MPYKTLSDLPDTVKGALPYHAQEIYRAAFNKAWEEYDPQKRDIVESQEDEGVAYKESKKRETDETPEEISDKAAWAAVRKKYAKREDKWVEV